VSQEIGLIAEQHARAYLTAQGMQWVMSNYRCRWGEIDLIMRDGPYLVFIEVRSRVSAEFGGAIESITRQKQRKILKTATHYMIAHHVYHSCSARFDVLSLQGVTQQIEWIKNAFGADF